MWIRNFYVDHDSASYPKPTLSILYLSKLLAPPPPPKHISEHGSKNNLLVKNILPPFSYAL